MVRAAAQTYETKADIHHLSVCYSITDKKDQILLILAQHLRHS